jgi:hypothetical protein
MRSYRPARTSTFAAALFLVVVSTITVTGATAAAAEPAPSQPNGLDAKAASDGWIRLFDGATTFGWTSNNEEVNWSVKEGVIQADSGPAGLLVTTTPFADYELLCDCWLAEGGNSGVFVRTKPNPKSVTADCYELNVCDNHPQKFNTGSIVGVAPSTKDVKGTGAWRKFHVRCEGPRIQIRIDGELVQDFTDSRPEAKGLSTGRIGLQKNMGLAKYRNIYLRPLGTTALFNGKDLAGWRVVPGGKSVFTVKDAAIHVANGRGFLETEGTWADFILQAEIKTNGDGLNSGIFFRAQKGTAEAPSNGYEAQVHNLFKGKDPTKPVDFGTGGIYRRIPARRVSARDKEWFTLTVAAHGTRIACWVDGDQVTDWTDDRKPNQNPREGASTAAGHFSLQGHDPTTDLLFRNIRVVGK